MNEPRPTATPAHLGLRLTALTYDLLPLAALCFVGATLALALTGGALDVHRFADKALVQGIVLALCGGYFVISWLRGGQTVGMRAWRLRVVTATGERVELPRALLRCTVALLSCGIGLLWCLVDRDRRAWHDLAAGTLVVRLEK